MRRLLLGICLLSLAACSRPARSRDKLIVGVSASLNLGNSNPVLIQRNANVWETLTELDDTLTPRPQLAESWDVSPDGRQWVFRLRPNVRFHNGEPLTAALVVANIERLRAHPELDYYSTFTHLESIAALNPLTVELRFARPLVDLPNKVGHYFAGIFSPSAFGPGGRLSAPLGSGPYVFVESRIAQSDLVCAFDQYRAGAPPIREVEFRVIPDPAVRVMSLLRGDIDLIAHHGGVPVNYLDMLRGRADVVVASQDVAITHYVLFNCSRRPLSDVTCRDAFDRALDRTALVRLIRRGGGTAASDFLIPAARQWNRGRFSPTPSEDASKRLRACAAGRPLLLLLNQGDTSSWGYRYVADYLADYYAHLGLELRVEALEGGAWQKAVQSGQYDITLYPLSAPTGTPELLIRRLAFSKGMRVRGIGNTTRYSSADVDALFDQAVNAPTAAIQAARFNALLDRLATDKPFVPLYHERYYYAYRRGLAGVHVDPFLKLDLHAVHWDKAAR